MPKFDHGIAITLGLSFTATINCIAANSYYNIARNIGRDLIWQIGAFYINHQN